MSLFKKRVGLENYCRSIYDNYLSDEWGVQAGKFVAEKIKQDLCNIDNRFIDLSVEKMTLENEYLRFEIFSLAWARRFLDNSNLIIEQSIFTKNYLRNHNRNDIWSGMENYNQAMMGGYTKIPTFQEDFLKRFMNVTKDFQCLIISANRFTLCATLKNMEKERLPGLEYVTIKNFLNKCINIIGIRLGVSSDFTSNEKVTEYFKQFLYSFYDECLKSFNEIKI